MPHRLPPQRLLHQCALLDEAQKENLDATKAKALMLEQPSMIKRPVLDVNGKITVGFKPEIYQQIFKA